MTLHHQLPYEETDDEDDQLEDIDPLPPSLRVPRLPQQRPTTIESALQDGSQNIGIKREATPFVPALEAPRNRTHNVGFNPIRPRANNIESTVHASSSVSTGQAPPRSQPSLSRMYSLSVADPEEVAETTTGSSVAPSNNSEVRPCSKRRKTQQRSSHARGTTRPAPPASVSENLPDPAKHSKGGLKSAGRIKKDGTPYERIPHDRTKGLSMTRQAVDYRERKEVQRQYQARLTKLLDADIKSQVEAEGKVTKSAEKDYRAGLGHLLDSDIVEQVEAEGGITPDGRLFKAAVRMMERVIDERADRFMDQTKVETVAVSPKTLSVADETLELRERAVRAEEKLVAFKRALQDIVVD